MAEREKKSSEREGEKVVEEINRRTFLGLGGIVALSMALGSCNRPESTRGELTDRGESTEGLSVSKPTKTSEPTPTPSPTKKSTPEATPIPKVTEQHSADELEEKHRARLEELDPIFRKSGFDAWLKKAGFTWDTIQYRTDQIIEETWSEEQWASGVPVTVTGLNTPWPCALTTNEYVPTGRHIEAGPENQLCTDVENFNGKATVYVDVQNWPELDPES